MWDHVVYSDAEKVLRVIQRVEREEEMKERRERNLRDTMEREALAQQEAGADGAAGSPSGGGEGDGRKEKRRKRDTGKSLSEDQLKKMSDRTARGVLGGKQYSWMTAGASGAPLRPASPLSGSNGLPKTKFPPQPSASSGAVSAIPSAGLPRLDSMPSFQDTPREKASNRITLGDAAFALEKERGFGAGAGTGQTALYSALARRRPGV
jgi:Transcription initiation factor TFIID component TAF4 family